MRMPETIEVAMAINGPWLPVPKDSKFSLEQLRSVRWNQLSKQEQGSRLMEAKAVLRLFGYSE